MTIEERKSKIEMVAKMQKEKAKLKEQKEKDEFNKLLTECKNYNDRIKELLETARYCNDNEIEIPTKLYADGFYHSLGFVSENSPYSNKNPKIFALGIINGGACGNLDFYNTGDNMYSKNKNDDSIGEPRRRDMEIFLEDFEPFETSFYDFIDSL